MEQSTKVWVQSGECFFLRDRSDDISVIKNEVYSIEAMPMTNELYLKRMSSKFEFDFKIYGLEKNFISKVLKTYTNTTGNLGLILNGIKGTGKTITAEILANELGLPIILINTAYGGINTFLASIPQNITILIDEYEKTYKGNVSEDDYGNENATGDSTLLSLMDGTYKTVYRKVFLLTTNRTWVNENLLNRPGRIRYLKQFNDLTREQIMEIIDDCLVDKKYTEDIITFMKPLSIITVDIVKAIISEINIFDESPDICCKDMNLEFKDESYNIIKLPTKTGAKPKVFKSNIPVNYVNQFISKSKSSWKTAILSYDDFYLRNSEEPESDDVYTVYDNYDIGGNTKDTKFKVMFEKIRGVHSSLII